MLRRFTGLGNGASGLGVFAWLRSLVAGDPGVPAGALQDNDLSYLTDNDASYLTDN